MKKERFRKVRRTWLGLLNSVLAIAASLSTKAAYLRKKEYRNPTCIIKEQMTSEIENGMPV